MKNVMIVLGAAVLLAACDSTPDARPAATPDAAAMVGSYELWLCATADCGPGATSPGSRIGRLQLTQATLPMTEADSATALLGCATVGPVARVDTTTTLTAVRWRMGESAGRFVFAIDEGKGTEFEISLDEIGGTLRGDGRWRRNGMITEEAHEFVVARRTIGKVKLACAAPASAEVAPVAPAPATGKSKGAGKRGR